MASDTVRNTALRRGLKNLATQDSLVEASKAVYDKLKVDVDSQIKSLKTELYRSLSSEISKCVTSVISEYKNFVQDDIAASEGTM